MATSDDRRSRKQRDALWRWRWLGWRDSTPAFKVSIAALVLVAIAFAVVSLR
ncbi:MAG: hypothetical protein WCL16_11110 [bacterium]